LGDLADGEHADKEVLAGQSIDGAQDGVIRLGTAQFRNSARVQQDSQSLLLRMGDRSRVRSRAFQAGAFAGEEFLEAGALSGEPLVFSSRDYHYRVFAPVNELGAFRKGAVDDLAEPVLCLCDLPFHADSPSIEII